MMQGVIRIDDSQASAELGRVRLDSAKILWRAPLIGISIIGAPLFFSWSALFLFLTLSYVTLLMGHSIGMHRMMIHRSFRAPKPLERALIYIGVLVGMGGPFDIIRTHDMRDWAQRQAQCHDYFSHKRGFIKDVIWQLFYRFEFTHAPTLTVEDRLRRDPYLIFMQKTWPLHQIFLAAIFYLIGGWPWVIWGVALRVSVSIIGHWTITYFCHNPGPQDWLVTSAGVQASNLKLPSFIGGILTHGECWHNNHHAFPESARIGLHAGQIDPAWAIISRMQKWGWISAVGVPRPDDQREDLSPATTR